MGSRGKWWRHKKRRLQDRSPLRLGGVMKVGQVSTKRIELTADDFFIKIYMHTTWVPQLSHFVSLREGYMSPPWVHRKPVYCGINSTRNRRNTRSSKGSVSTKSSTSQLTLALYFRCVHWGVREIHVRGWDLLPRGRSPPILVRVAPSYIQSTEKNPPLL